MSAPDPSNAKFSAVFRLLVAWLLVSAVLFFTSIVTAYDGALTLLSAPLWSLAFGAFTVTICAVLSLLLRIGPLGQRWRSSLSPATTLLVLGVGLVLYSYTQISCGIDSITNTEFTQIGASFLPGLLLIAFAFANWPSVMKSSDSSSRDA